MKTTRTIAHAVIVLLGVVILSPANAEWQADDSIKLQRKSAAAIDAVRKRYEGIESYFDDAYGYAVFHSIKRIGLGFGGAYGKGVLIEQNELVGTSGYWQFSSGIQAGAKAFSMIVFFKDKVALDSFKASEAQFVGQTGIDLLTVGAAITPSYHKGVAIFTVTRLGLMGEFSASGVKYTYKPIAQTNRRNR